MNKTTQIKFNNVKRNLHKNAPLIMTTLGIAGSLGAVLHAFKIAPKTKEVLDEVSETYADESKPKQIWEKTKAVAPIIWPVVVMEGTSIGCAVGSYKMNAKRLSALATAYALSERRFSDYRDQVIKQIGEKKEQKVRDEVAKEQVKKTPLTKGSEVTLDDDEQLYFDPCSARYFKCTPQKLGRIENELNRRLQTEMYISLNELYYELGLQETSLGDEVGFNIDKDLIDITRVTSMVLEDGRTCAVLDYRVGPQFDYRDLH